MLRFLTAAALICSSALAQSRSVEQFSQNARELYETLKNLEALTDDSTGETLALIDLHFFDQHVSGYPISYSFTWLMGKSAGRRITLFLSRYQPHRDLGAGVKMIEYNEQSDGRRRRYVRETFNFDERGETLINRWVL